MKWKCYHKKLPKIKLVLFDWSDTLAVPPITNTDLVIRNVISKDKDKDKDTILKTVLKDGVLEILQYLKSKKIPVGIVSNTGYLREEFQEALKLDLNRYFCLSLITDHSNDNMNNKSYNSIFQKTILSTRLNSRNILFVGENYQAGIISAAKQGMQTVYVNNINNINNINNVNNECHHYLKNEIQTYVIRSLKELKNIVV